MSQDLSSAVAVPVSRPAHWVRQAALVVGGTALLTLPRLVLRQHSTQPVPVSLQTFAVLMVGALYGWRLGELTVLAWLLEAAAGMPVLAGGKCAGPVLRPTAGYLFAFPLGAMLMGWLATRGAGTVPTRCAPSGPCRCAPP